MFLPARFWDFLDKAKKMDYGPLNLTTTSRAPYKLDGDGGNELRTVKSYRDFTGPIQIR